MIQICNTGYLEKRKWLSASWMEQGIVPSGLYRSRQKIIGKFKYLPHHFAPFQGPGKHGTIYDSPDHSFMLSLRETLPCCAISFPCSKGHATTNPSRVICAFPYAGEKLRLLKFPQELLLKISIYMSLKTEEHQSTWYSTSSTGCIPFVKITSSYLNIG